MAIASRNLEEIRRELRAITRQSRAAREHLERIDARRDEMIRLARSAGLSQQEVMELTGLSRPRINQIMRGSRV